MHDDITDITMTSLDNHLMSSNTNDKHSIPDGLGKIAMFYPRLKSQIFYPLMRQSQQKSSAFLDC